MRRSGAVKFPNSVQLFKFCQKVLMHQKGGKVRDQEVGRILKFNPSDCSHWKRGEKNVKSVFALAKLAETLQVEPGLIHDVASGMVNLDEAYFEYLESKSFQKVYEQAAGQNQPEIARVREQIEAFVAAIHEQCDFGTPPLYLPEVMRTFSFVSSQPVEMMDKLSRILRIKQGQYCIQYKKGDVKPQTRMSMVKDLSRIILEGERERFPELGASSGMVELEQAIFTASLLVPKSLMMNEMSKLDLRRNVVAELAAMFWVPKSLVCFQLQDILRSGAKRERPVTATSQQEVVTAV